MGSLTPETCSPNSQTSSFGSCPWMMGQELHVNTADELGMKALNDRFYAPFLTCELERLFSPPTGNSPDSQTPLRSVWAEFENNGHDTELDDLDRLFRGMSTDEHSKKAQQLENLPAPLIMNDIRDVGLLHSGLDLPQVTPLELQQQAASLELKQATSNLMEDIFTKARLIEILRERERLQRSRPKKVQKKASTTKVCVFCRNNGEAETVYSSHQLKDPEGNVTCPILYIYTCPICGANGKMAHTIKYCPYNSGDSLCIQPLNRGITSPIGKQLVSLI